jgi:hypothetical protein
MKYILVLLFMYAPLLLGSCQKTETEYIITKPEKGVKKIKLLALVEQTNIRTFTEQERSQHYLELEVCNFGNMGYTIEENLPEDVKETIYNVNSKTHGVYYLISEDYKYGLDCIIPYDKVCVTFMWYDGIPMTILYFVKYKGR